MFEKIFNNNTDTFLLRFQFYKKKAWSMVHTVLYNTPK